MKANGVEWRTSEQSTSYALRGCPLLCLRKVSSCQNEGVLPIICHWDREIMLPLQVEPKSPTVIIVDNLLNKVLKDSYALMMNLWSP